MRNENRRQANNDQCETKRGATVGNWMNSDALEKLTVLLLILRVYKVFDMYLIYTVGMTCVQHL